MSDGGAESNHVTSRDVASAQRRRRCVLLVTKRSAETHLKNTIPAFKGGWRQGEAGDTEAAWDGRKKRGPACGLKLRVSLRIWDRGQPEASIGQHDNGITRISCVRAGHVLSFSRPPNATLTFWLSGARACSTSPNI